MPIQTGSHDDKRTDKRASDTYTREMSNGHDDQWSVGEDIAISYRGRAAVDDVALGGGGRARARQWPDTHSQIDQSECIRRGAK